ncbi:hypothetical protein K6T82_06890 [Flavobacterium sp. 17A]|uniref:Uncharacterized protein n=1 Tax=Flavobacterium potami TaxID=2872310 RepID=A0A9X1H976_9FLAO|nr:hypothetical protein [Flavobacterium potami]MBZ4034485.1 hypothetical protein [Flavobacterium potami]
MKYLLFTFFTLSISFAQSPKQVIKKLGSDPVFFIDSVSVQRSDLEKYAPEDISSVTVFKGKEAVELLGEDGKDGAVYIETTLFCKKRYWKYFTSKSSKYKELVSSPEQDTNVQYIINDRVLTDKSAGDLATIDDKIFKSIQFIPKEELIKKYNIQDKDYGFQIMSKIPKDLYNAKSKF